MINLLWDFVGSRDQRWVGHLGPLSPPSTQPKEGFLLASSGGRSEYSSVALRSWALALVIPCQLALMGPSGSSSQNIVAIETSTNWNKQAQHLCCWWLTPTSLCLHTFGLLLLKASLLHSSGNVSADKTAGTLPEEHNQ